MAQLKQQCSNCPFLNGRIHPELIAKIYADLLEGIDYLCHSDRTRETICSGAYQYRLAMQDLVAKISGRLEGEKQENLEA